MSHLAKPSLASPGVLAAQLTPHNIKNQDVDGDGADKDKEEDDSGVPNNLIPAMSYVFFYRFCKDPANPTILTMLLITDENVKNDRPGDDGTLRSV